MISSFLTAVVVLAAPEGGGIGLRGGVQGGVVGGIVGESRPVYVHIESDRPELVLVRAMKTAGYVTTGRTTMILGRASAEACRAPCDARVRDPYDQFFVQAPGMRTSALFSLTGRGESVNLKVRPGSQTRRSLGITALTVGIVGLVGGGSLLAAGGLATASNSTTSSIPNPYQAGVGGTGSTLVVTGVIAAIAGAVLTAVGIPLLVSSGTSVAFTPGPPPPADSSPETSNPNTSEV
jgi:hypothetical protein